MSEEFLEDAHDEKSVENLRERIKELEKINCQLAKCADTLNAENEDLKSDFKAVENSLSVWFSPSQMKVLLDGAKGPKWDDDAIQKSMTIIANAGERNLELIRKYVPLPSSTTTYRHMQKFQKYFNTGFLQLNAHMLKEKYESRNLLPSQHYLALGFDAKQIVSGIQFNASSGTKTGIATIEPTPITLEKNPQKLASHAVIFLAMGLDPRIKEIVGFELAADSCDPESMKEKLFNVIIQTENHSNQKVR